jgi:hypothetical protein
MDWAKTLDVLSKITTILVLSLGAIGAYYKFLKGRIFRPRLQLDVGGRVIQEGGVVCLLVNLQIKNVGASTVEFSREGTHIKIYSYDPEFYEPITHQAVWQSLDTFRIFEHIGWIESGEQTQDALLIALPHQPQVAFRVDMIVIAHDIAFKTRTVIGWTTPESIKTKERQAT